MSNCPQEVLEQIFSDLFAYMLTRKKDLLLKMVVENDEKYLKFPKSKAFKKEGEFYQYNIRINDGKSVNHSNQNYSIREATKADIQEIVNVYHREINKDIESLRQGAENMVNLMLQRDIKFIAMKGEDIVGGFAVGKGEESDDFVQSYPSFTIPDHEKSIISLIQKGCEMISERGWTEQFVRLIKEDNKDLTIKAIESIPHIKKILAIKFGL